MIVASSTSHYISHYSLSRRPIFWIILSPHLSSFPDRVSRLTLLCCSRISFYVSSLPLYSGTIPVYAFYHSSNTSPRPQHASTMLTIHVLINAFFLQLVWCNSVQSWCLSTIYFLRGLHYPALISIFTFFRFHTLHLTFTWAISYWCSSIFLIC